MSFKEKFRRFTSPTTNRKGGDQGQKPSDQGPGVPGVPGTEAASEVPTSKKTIREKLACALSPESLRKKSVSLSASEGSPQKKKRSTVIEEDREASPRPQGQGQGQGQGHDQGAVEPTCLMPLSPSINFIDAVPSEDNAPPPVAADSKAQDDVVPGEK